MDSLLRDMKKIIDYLWMNYVATHSERIAVYQERLESLERKMAKSHECLTSDCKHQ